MPRGSPRIPESSTSTAAPWSSRRQSRTKAISTPLVSSVPISSTAGAAGVGRVVTVLEQLAQELARLLHQQVIVALGERAGAVVAQELLNTHAGAGGAG